MLSRVARIYRWAYTRWGGRPWTYISQDSIRSKQAVWVVGCIAGGIIATILLHPLSLVVGLLTGVILGHIFWTSPGKKAREAESILRDYPETGSAVQRGKWKQRMLDWRAMDRGRS